MKTKKTKLSFNAFEAKAGIEKNALAKITAGTLGGCYPGGGAGADPIVKGKP